MSICMSCGTEHDCKAIRRAHEKWSELERQCENYRTSLDTSAQMRKDAEEREAELERRVKELERDCEPTRAIVEREKEALARAESAESRAATAISERDAWAIKARDLQAAVEKLRDLPKWAEVRKKFSWSMIDTDYLQELLKVCDSLPAAQPAPVEPKEGA